MINKGNPADIIKALKGFDNIDDAAKWFGRMNGASEINDDIIKLFNSAFDNIVVDDLKDAIAEGAASSGFKGALSAGISGLVNGVASTITNLKDKISALGSGALSVATAHPVAAIGVTGITAAIAAYTAYKKSIEEAVSAAKSAGSTWEENTTFIQDNISRIQELRTALASGTLTEQEAADAKSELLSIQESLSESYGNQVSGIDLINGSLTEQIALLDQVNEKQSQNFLNENKKGIDKAQKEMEKNRHTYLGQFYDNGSEESEAIKKSIKKLQETYGEDVFKLDSADGITMDIQFNADASTAKDALNDFMTEVSGIEDQFGETDVTDQLANNAASGLTKAKDVLSEYQDIYDQAQKAELLSDDKLYKSGDTEQKASKWISDYAKAVEDYNNAISDGDNSKISEASQKFSELDSTVNGLVKNTGMSAYADQVKEVRDELNDTAIANDKFTKAVNGTDTSKFGKSISKNVKALKELNLTDTDFRYAFETDGVQEGEDQINALVQAALDAGVISDTSASSVANLASMLAELGVISSSTGSSLDEAADSIGDISERIDKTSAALTGIQKAESVLDAQSTGKSISLDDFNSDELADYTSALEYNNGALQLNAEKVRELQKAKAEEQIQTNNSQKAEKQNQYMQNIAQIEQLQDQLRGLTDAKGEEAQAIQSSIDALLSDNDAIVNQCNQLDLLSASLREATGAYQNWLDKQNASESGDMFDDAMGAMEKIDNVTKNSDSEDYGRVGTNSYKAAVDFIVPDTVDSQDAESVSSYMSSIEHYFNHDEDGNRIGLDVQEFCAKATKAGLMELDEASGEYKVAGQKTMEDFAEGLNLSMPMVQAMFGEMEEFGGEFDWADEATKTLGDMAVAAGEAKGRIEEMSGDTDMNIQIDVSDIDNTEDKVKTLDNTIAQMQNYKTTLDVDSSQVDDANAVIQYCVTQKQMLEAPAVMSVDTSQVDGELGNALSLLQQFQEAQNSVELQASVGADTSEAQGKVDSLVGEIQGLSPEIKATLGIDTTSADTITSYIKGLTPEVMVKMGVNSDAVDAYAAEEKQSSGKVTWDNETGAVDAFAAQVHRSSGLVSWGNDTSRVKTYFTAEGHVNWKNTTAPTKGAGGANGTAHAAGSAQYNHLSGHAQASGNWATKTGGTTLVGELGREIVVNPATGTWNTVGDNGAEFVNIPAGSIVFNHLQTEALLDRGFINSRGLAQASGSAMVRGGIPVKQASIASHKTTYKGSNTNKKKNNNSNNNNNITKTLGTIEKNTKKTADNTSDWKDPWENMQDWFERYTTRIDNKLDLNSAISENYQGNKSNKKNPFSISAKNKTLDYSINTIKTDGIPKYQKQRKYYVDAAERYANKIGLSQSLRDKVQKGRIKDIQGLSETDKSKVEAYAKWYDKIHEVDSAIEDLKSKEADLWNQKFSNITDRYDALKDIYSGKNDIIDAHNDYRQELGASESYKSNYAKDIKKQKSNQIKQNAITDEERRKYKAELTKLGEEYGTQSTIYKQAQAGLLDLNKEYYEGKKAVEEFSNKLKEIKLNDLQKVIDKYDRASDRQSSYRDWKDATNFKGISGITQKDLKEAIKTNDNSINALYAKRAEVQRQLLGISPGNSEYQDKTKELTQLDKDILSTAKNTAELRQQMAQLRWDQYDKAIDKLDRITTDCENIQGMMDSDTFMSDDGSLTTNGLTNIALENQSIQTNQRKIATWKQDLADLQKMYDNHYITEEQFLSQSKQITSNINSAAKDIYSSQQNLIDIYINKITKENEYLQDNISKRKEALEAKKDYYDYDKTIKNKTKDINTIKAQIAALEGTTNAVAKAKLEQLKADLADKQEDLNDTKYDHKIDMESKGYDNLANQSDKALDSATQAVKTNADMQKSIISNMLNEVKANYKDVYSNITDIVKDSGAQISKEFNKILTNIGNGKGNFTVTVTGNAKSSVNSTNAYNSKAPGGTGREDKSTDKKVGHAAKDGNSAKNASDQNGEGKQMTKAVTASPKSVSIGVGKSAKVKIGFKPTNATYKDFTYEVSKKGIVSISKGKSSISIKGVKDGSVKITIKGHGVACKSATVSVKVLKDGAKHTNTAQKIAKKTIGKSLNTTDVTKILNATSGKSNDYVKSYTEKYISKKYPTEKKQQTAINNQKKQKTKSAISQWFSSLPTFKGNASKVKGTITKHLAQKGKKATVADIQKAASILGYKDYKNVAKWNASQKKAFVSKLKGYGFANGGIIQNLIPADINTILGNAIIKNGDTGLISARQGETVLTEEFTNMLKPTVTAMNAFTEMFQKLSTPNTNTPTTRQQNIFSPEYNINITGMDLNKANDLKKVIRGELDKHDKELARDFKKFR